jgi:hypothetical protein
MSRCRVVDVRGSWMKTRRNCPRLPQVSLSPSWPQLERLFQVMSEVQVSGWFPDCIDLPTPVDGCHHFKLLVQTCPGCGNFPSFTQSPISILHHARLRRTGGRWWPHVGDGRICNWRAATAPSQSSVRRTTVVRTTVPRPRVGVQPATRRPGRSLTALVITEGKGS